jgi:hypothetical protein
MKIYTCLECGRTGCKLDVEGNAGKPEDCPYGVDAKWTLEEK